jgi:ABC-type multidrug transport system ATPase subunit
LTDKFITIFMVKLLRYFRLRGLEQVRGQYLSVTQKKKVSLAIALLGFPKILLFDEVTGNVDLEGRRRINYLIKSYTT